MHSQKIVKVHLRKCLLGHSVSVNKVSWITGNNVCWLIDFRSMPRVWWRCHKVRKGGVIYWQYHSVWWRRDMLGNTTYLNYTLLLTWAWYNYSPHYFWVMLLTTLLVCAWQCYYSHYLCVLGNVTHHTTCLYWAIVIITLLVCAGQCYSSYYLRVLGNATHHTSYVCWVMILTAPLNFLIMGWSDIKIVIKSPFIFFLYGY